LGRPAGCEKKQATAPGQPRAAKKNKPRPLASPGCEKKNKPRQFWPAAVARGRGLFFIWTKKQASAVACYLDFRKNKPV